MSFILSADRSTGPATARGFAMYRAYLAQVRNDLPPGVAAIAPADWYYDATDHRSPHDAWLESMSIIETGRGSRQEKRTTSIAIRLLAAYHDGHIEFHYRDVTRYSLDLYPLPPDRAGEHRDWLYDEFRLTPTGRVEHEIEWAGSDSDARWVIEAADIDYRWLPLSGPIASFER